MHHPTSPGVQVLDVVVQNIWLQLQTMTIFDQQTVLDSLQQMHQAHQQDSADSELQDALVQNLHEAGSSTQVAVSLTEIQRVLPDDEDGQPMTETIDPNTSIQNGMIYVIHQLLLMQIWILLLKLEL